MNRRLSLGWCLAVVLCGMGADLSAGPLDWPKADRTCRPWAYNWWLGSAVDRENLARELHRYRAGGLGGIHIVPIYGAKGAEGRYIEYLSPKWLEMFSFTVDQAEQLDLGVDMTTGTGWCFGGPHIDPQLGGRKLVVRRIDPPAGGKLPPELLPPKLSLQAILARGPDGGTCPLLERLKPGGVLHWSPPAPGWSLIVLGHQFSGRMVKRAAPGGAGPMINPFYAAAMQAYLKPFTAAFAASGVRTPRAMYHDSFEYISNWSPDLLEQFAARRGYRLEDHLHTLAGLDRPAATARVRCDVSETLSDMLIEDVFPQWVRWCHQHGMLTRNQAHGAPANWLDFYALADIPETEMFGHGGPDPLQSGFDEHIAGADRNPLISKFASSAAHLTGRRLVSSETGTWLAEHFCETFEELKCEIDLLFLSGVNHVFYHGCVYSPDDAPWPGWLFYASTQMNPRNPLWREAAALNSYVARCQSILREGTPDNDLLVYWPIHDLWTEGVTAMSVHNKVPLKGSLGPVAQELWNSGYGFDYVSDRLLARLDVQNGALCGPRGTRWQAVVVPVCGHMPHQTLAKLVELARRGATVVFQDRLPDDVPGLGRLQMRRQALREIRSRLVFGEPVGGVRTAVVDKGRVLLGDLSAALATSGIARETMVDRAGVRVIRRRHAQGRYYLIVNHGLQPLDDWVPLATVVRSVVVMNPMDGRTGLGSLRSGADDRAEVYLRIEPGGSIILRTFEEPIDGQPFDWLVPGPAVARISGPWHLEFIAGGPKLPRPVTTEVLKSWTEFPDPALEAFAGTGRYQCTFDRPEGLPAQSGRGPLLLDLGEVKHVARVRLNGKDLGTVFMHPYRVPIPPHLLKGRGNRLEIEVTNLGANRIRDLDCRKVPWKIFHNINLVSIRYRPLDASSWPVFSSGLLGPVTLRTSTAGARTE